MDNINVAPCYRADGGADRVPFSLPNDLSETVPSLARRCRSSRGNPSGTKG
jgi:hypothetical protein